VRRPSARWFRRSSTIRIGSAVSKRNAGLPIRESDMVHAAEPGLRLTVAIARRSLALRLVGSRPVTWVACRFAHCGRPTGIDSSGPSGPHPRRIVRSSSRTWSGIAPWLPEPTDHSAALPQHKPLVPRGWRLPMIVHRTDRTNRTDRSVSSGDRAAYPVRTKLSHIHLGGRSEELSREVTTRIDLPWTAAQALSQPAPRLIPFTPATTCR
jgi:hypothetical protein